MTDRVCFREAGAGVIGMNAPKGHRNKARGWPTEEAYPGVTAGGEPSPKGMWTGAYSGLSAAVAECRNAPLRNTFGVGLPSPGIPG